MDREAAVIRAEMSQTRAELDHKLTVLEGKARQFNPRRYAQQYMPDYLLDRFLGGLLTLVGLKMAWSRYSESRDRRARVRAALTAYGRW